MCDRGHHRRVRHPQTPNPVHPEPFIDHAIAAHVARSDGVEDRRRNRPGGRGQTLVIVRRGPRANLRSAVTLQRRLRADPPGQADRIGRHPPILGGREIVRPNGGRDPCVRGRGVHTAARLRCQVADTGSKGGIRVQRCPETIEAQGLNVVLQVDRGTIRVGTGETPQLTGRHRHGTATEQQVLQRDSRLAPQRSGSFVEGVHISYPVHQPYLQVILEILAHRAAIHDRRHAELRQAPGLANPRQFEDLRRADGTGREHHFARRVHAD